MADKKTKKEPPKAEKKNPVEEMFNTDKDLIDNSNLIFDQYKLYVEMADRISARRATTNSFYLTANSFLFVALGILMSNDLVAVVPIILIVGIFVSISWWLLIIYYKNLNSSKYKVINAIEEKLPVKGLFAEWQISKAQDKPLKKSRGLTFIEQWIPISLLCLYSIALIIISVILILVAANVMTSPF
ncbi:MAG: RipA family octameric membrane protein [Candidatus Heimdallarchaeota archaeon]